MAIVAGWHAHRLQCADGQQYLRAPFRAIMPSSFRLPSARSGDTVPARQMIGCEEGKSLTCPPAMPRHCPPRRQRPPTRPCRHSTSRTIFLITAAHFFHDMYPSFLAPLIPLLTHKFGLSLFLAGFLQPRATPLLALPARVGYYADRTSVRLFLVITPITTALVTCSLGIAPNALVVVSPAARQRRFECAVPCARHRHRSPRRRAGDPAWGCRSS